MATSSELFAVAHRITKSVHIEGDCYYVTFGQSLRIAHKMIADIKAGKRTITPAGVAAMLFVDKLDMVAEYELRGKREPLQFNCTKVVHMANVLRSMVALNALLALTLTITYTDGTTITFEVVGE